MKDLNAMTVLKTFLLTLSIVVLLMGGFIWYASKEPTIGGNFALIHRDQKWEFSKGNRHLNLLYVGYVKCPDVCPLSLSHSAQAFQQLTDRERKDVQLIFISVDANHDTPSSVADYASQFFSEFIGLTGSESEISKVVTLFGASYMVDKNPKSYLGYSIAHTDRLFFLNDAGFVIDSIPNPRSADDILTKIKGHL